MNQRRFYLSFFITSFVLYLYVTLFPRFARPIFHSINPAVFTKETEERVDSTRIESILKHRHQGVYSVQEL